MSIKSKVTQLLHRISANIRFSFEFLRGAAYALDIFIIIFAGYVTMQLNTPLHNVVEFTAGCVIGLILILVADLIRRLVTAVSKRVPGVLITALLGLVATAFALFGTLLGLKSLLAGILLVLVSVTILGGTGTLVLRGHFREMLRWQRVITVLPVMVTASTLFYAGIWLYRSGVPTSLEPYTFPTMNGITPLTVPNPGERGTYEVQILTYGSGTDKQRPEYGAAVNITTTPVNAAALLPEWNGVLGTIYWEYWGFNTDALPLNGRVWYPVGDETFPIVLIVHGNHVMTEFSDPGYAYLGDFLASRGYIVVSVDENFLNWHGFPLPEMGNENDARAWLLLQHLAMWREWNSSEDNPFYGKVDLDNVALIGHSRGGEAVYIAGEFNRLSRYPDNANVTFDFNFGIRAIVALAPIDGQYNPAGRQTALENVNYLVLHGSYDGDVAHFDGIRHYQRLRFTDETYHFKATLYIDRANHGQFNSVWGRTDAPAPKSWFMNFDPILDGDVQRQITLTYVDGFLEASLRGETAYIPMFSDYRTALAWLPETRYINRFADSTYQTVADFKEDVDLTTTTLPDGRIDGSQLIDWYETNLPFQQDWQENRAVILGWNTPDGTDSASYSVTLPENSPLILAPEKSLVFSIGNLGQIPDVPQEMREDGIEYASGESSGQIDVTLKLIDGNRVVAALPLSTFGDIPAPIRIQLLKSGFIKVGNLGADTVKLRLQTITVPLTAFAEANPDLNIADLREITLVFDRVLAGTVALSEIAVRD